MQCLRSVQEVTRSIYTLQVLLKYTEYNEPHESRTNQDIMEALSRKEGKQQAGASGASRSNAPAGGSDSEEEDENTLGVNDMSAGRICA